MILHDPDDTCVIPYITLEQHEIDSMNDSEDFDYAYPDTIETQSGETR